MLAAALALCGCGAGGFSLDKAAGVDGSLVTASVAGGAPAADAGIAADLATIRNAVSSADLDGQAGRPLAWANPQTGTRGTITGLAQSTRQGRLCRSFSGSRESFDGVSMFSGTACMAAADLWQMEDLKLL